VTGLDAPDWWGEPVPENVTIGEGSWLYSSFAFSHYASRRPVGVSVGRKTGIYIGTMFNVGRHGEVVVGDFCTLAGPIISTNGRVVIGDHTLISFRVVIADDAVSMPPTSRGAVDAPSPGSSLEIGPNAWIGAAAILLAGARIGEGAVVGAAAVVDFDVPPHAIVAGSPARVVGWAPSKG